MVLYCRPAVVVSTLTVTIVLEWGTFGLLGAGLVVWH